MRRLTDRPRKHTNISSTNQGHGLCYYFFVEVKGSRVDAGVFESESGNRLTSHPYQNQVSMLGLRDRV